ncbi:hypothetical protein [Micromonospora arborensis]|uniref:hypothetical protein n=1 Tax=Micromonospora arborensis TaxID=2116518 RepID=UPI003720D877
MLFNTTSKIDAQRGDVIEVTATSDAQSYRIRVALIDTIDAFPVVTGQLVDDRGRATGELQTVVLDGSDPYTVVAGRNVFTEFAFGRSGRHRLA